MKTIAISWLTIAICLTYPFLCSAQEEQSTYIRGKEYFDQGNYAQAIESFKKLADPNAVHAYREYASFYYALAAYKNQQLGLARSMWLQVEEKYPRWNKMPDVYYWLAQVYFEEKSYTQATYYAKKSGLPESNGQLQHYLSEIDDRATLLFLHEQFREDKEIGFALASFVSKEPLESRDFGLLSSLSSRFDFDASSFGLPDIGESKLKNQYNVAVLLPFMYNGLEDTRRITRNKFVMDLYEGIMAGLQDLDPTKAEIRVWPYDTKRDLANTEVILNTREMKSMDLIIGPLFPGPSKVTSDFCFENKINMINPVSSNSRVIQNNPYSFLFKPSNEVEGATVANYAKDQYENKNTIIFYNKSLQDSLVAASYRKKMVAEGYDIIHFLSLNDSTIHLANELLTQIYEDTLSVREADSIMRIPGKIVKERKPRDTRGNVNYKQDSVEYYQELFVIAPDSIGHIFLASSEPLHAANLISAIEIRSDTIPLIGRGEWLSFETLTMEEFERLGVVFVAPDYVDKEKESFISFRKKFQRKLKKEPSLNNMIGYELITYVGALMQEHGHYFQKGSLLKGVSPGKVFHGLDISTHNCNKVVPIIKFEDAELKVIND